MQLMGIQVVQYDASNRDRVTLVTQNPPGARVLNVLQDANWMIEVQPILIAPMKWQFTVRRGGSDNGTIYPS
ncbi:hypothetical protein D3C80_1591170 [compost metagenome]|jgi:hypothetical protein